MPEVLVQYNAPDTHTRVQTRSDIQEDALTLCFLSLFLVFTEGEEGQRHIASHR